MVVLLGGSSHYTYFALLVQEVGDETATSYAGAKETNQKPSLMHSYSMGDASVGEFSSVVNVARDSVRLSGTNPVLLKVSRPSYLEFFTGQWSSLNWFVSFC